MINTFINAINVGTKGAKLVRRASSSANWIIADVLGGTCIVQYANGRIYEYTNVSRRALFSLINNENVSLELFINNSLFNECHVVTTIPIAV